MPVYKDKNGSWYVMTRYKDWTGTRKQKCQRGFSSKREAQEWETQFKYQKQEDMDMSLESFYELYAEDLKNRLKENTWVMKDSIIRSKILPYLGSRKMSEITPRDVVKWQNTIMSMPGSDKGKISPSYMKSIHSQLSAMFNHAIKYYGLSVNPAQKAGNINVQEHKEMKFWTKDQYQKFAEVMMEKPIYYYAFEVLYWTGIREGELLALTPEDFIFEKRTLRINKSYQRLKGRDVITTPKTANSVRSIAIPEFLCEEIQDCLRMCFYHIESTDRIFQLTKYSLCKAMKNGSQQAGVPRIRVHDLRHSHVSFLINKGFSAFEIGKRVGHGGEKITYRYAHLFPNKQSEMADFLNTEWNIADMVDNKAKEHDGGHE